MNEFGYISNELNDLAQQWKSIDKQSTAEQINHLLWRSHVNLALDNQDWETLNRIGAGYNFLLGEDHEQLAEKMYTEEVVYALKRDDGRYYEFHYKWSSDVETTKKISTTFLKIERALDIRNEILDKERWKVVKVSRIVEEL